MANSMTLADSIAAQKAVHIEGSKSGVHGENKPSGRKTPIDGNSQKQSKSTAFGN